MSAERILVVDDEVGMLRGVERVLSADYSIMTSEDPERALGLAKEFQPELAILDVRMPVMDGFELMGRLREVRPCIDVIFMTGAVHELDSQLIRAIRERAFYFIQKPFDREVLLTLVERCLVLRRLSAENTKYVARLEGELAEAQSFQRGLMPGKDARFDRVHVSARCLPCDELGGDFYDWIEVSPGCASVLACDVSGHGVTAAMLTGIVKSAFHDAHTEDYAPQAVAGRVASAIRTFDDGKFVTLFCARVSSGGTVEYVNAGHPPPIAWGKDRALEMLTLTGPLISPAFAGLDWDCGRCELAAGDQLLVYTDGLTEARRGEDELWGDKRLFEAALSSTRRGSELIEDILARASEFRGDSPRDDDETLLCISLD